MNSHLQTMITSRLRAKDFRIPRISSNKFPNATHAFLNADVDQVRDLPQRSHGPFQLAFALFPGTLDKGRLTLDGRRGETEARGLGRIWLGHVRLDS